jgi:4-hydroxybenzoate polyprenyltransferase
VLNGLTRLLFFGNYFYGFCTVALSVEASLQQHASLNSIPYYLLVFVATVLYYTHAYIAEPSSNTANKRAAWYYENRKLLRWSQFVFTLLTLFLSFYLLRQNWQALSGLSVLQWAMIGVFPVVAALYYGSAAPHRSTHNLRNNGWLKPFVIGFVWAGAVTIYPVLFKSIEDGTRYAPEFISLLLFIKNFMYITMLCIMFDIKDYAADHNHQLKTFVVRYGLRKTIFYILIPLTLVGLGTFLVYAVLRDFPLLRILINTIPFILLIIVAYSMHRRKSILYYLAIIDGLMLAKAVCGIIGISLIK